MNNKHIHHVKLVSFQDNTTSEQKHDKFVSRSQKSMYYNMHRLYYVHKKY